MKKIKLYLLFSLFSTAIFGQINVVGTVVDEKGEQLIGVSVRVKGTSQGTITDFNGKFGINVAKLSDMLIFSSVGYTPLEQKVEKGKSMSVTLREDSKLLNEVVVIGYQDMKRKDLTGSVSKANVEDMLKAPVATFDQALAGRIAGVNVSSSEGTPGGNMNIVIRGKNSVTQENSPLYVIDGFPVEDPKAGASINPNDIESIDVLKDASATAIYGARGSNGVIIITTKRGKAGQLSINYDGNFGVQRITRKIPLMNAYEFVKLQSEVWNSTEMSSTGYFKTIDGKTYTSDDYKNVPQYDWQDLIFRDAVQQNHSLSLTGGTAENRYNASFSYYDQDGVVIASNYKRLQGKLGTDIRKNKLRINLSVNYSNSTQTGNSPSQSSSSGMNNLFYSVWGYRPVTQAGVPLNTLLDNGLDSNVDTSIDYRFNPYLSLINEYRTNNIAYTQFNGFAEYEFIKGLKLKVSGGYTTDVRKLEVFNNSNTRYGSQLSIDKVNATVGTSQSSTWLNENILTYQRLINKKHSINILGGFTLQENDFKYYTMKTTNIPNESLRMAGMSQGTPNVNDSGESEWSLLSSLGRVNYNYLSKYYFTASFRADGSSKFSTQNRFSYFPSTAIAWTFTEESFMAKFKKTVSSGKLRLGWGITGNNRVEEYARFARLSQESAGSGSYNDPSGYTHGVYSFDNTIIKGTVPISLANNHLKWEATEQWNAGLDLVFLNDRISTTIDYYDKITYDLLIKATLPISSGFGSAMKNIGEVRNQGLEISINTINIKKKQFSWNSSFNISFNQNKLLGLNEDQRSYITAEIVDRNFGGDNYIAKVGYPIGMMYGYIYEGTYKLDDFNMVGGNYVLKPGVAHYTAENNTQPGYPKYKDLNEDGVINSDDQTFIGRGDPMYIGGFTNNFMYKNLDLSIFFQWSYGADIINANRIMFETSFAKRKDLNQFASYANRWTFDNQQSNIPVVNNSSSNLLYSSRFIEDGSYLRLKTVSLGYNFPKKWIKELKINSLRVYFSAQNLFTWHNYSGYDPEVSIREKALTPNLDFSSYPKAASANFGVNLTL
ncbi:MAG: TonB-dependent receptor [Paludibacteraceae bacterium]